MNPRDGAEEAGFTVTELYAQKFDADEWLDDTLALPREERRARIRDALRESFGLPRAAQSQKPDHTTGE